MRPQGVKRVLGVACAIGGLWAFYVVLTGYGFYDSVSRTRTIATRVEINLFLVALERYRTDVANFPAQAQGLRALRADPGVPGWNGPYLLREIPLDPWGVPYRYALEKGHPIISSLGAGTAKGEKAIWSEGAAQN